ncbi:penicillin-binding transpeptidase domain-containing protein [Micromonospora sp. NBC_01699]|uniref:peptidoglycan D,D-transpeptidase FtsI family protein n=1 Tax=Micromonospora sp. NBC_01699 TaxID=2975984 RepID=UPI002E2E3DE1|nr:penicillin-binding transpeptidase domain-containing protein [Micromonospora sp. NBC_01699]
MSPRSDEPRRDGSTSRRGSSQSGSERDTGARGAGRDTGARGANRDTGGRGVGRGGATDGEPGLGGISGARAYTPRGRTLRDAPELRRTPRSTRSADPFRPALQVLDGGRTNGARTRREAPEPAAGRGTGTGRPVPPRAARAADVARPVPAPRRRTGTTTTSGSGRPGAAPRRAPRKPPSPPRLADSRLRLRLGTMLALALFATVGIRLVVLQVVQSPAYADSVDDRLKPVILAAPRGSIYDRSGAVLAHSVEARYVYADPTMVEDPADAAAKLSPLLGIPRSTLVADLSRTKGADGFVSQFQYLARGVEIDTAKQIMELNLAGIGTGQDERREVPGGDLAANLIGFIGDDMSGLEGIEARYEELLRGVNGKRVFEAGRGDLNSPIPGGYDKVVTEPKPGSSLQLTIDRDLQWECQRILSAAAREEKATIAAAIVIDIRTGAVLTQASHPTYSAADWKKSVGTDREDAATGFVVDPGSVHKAITFAAALEEGVIKPGDTVTVGNSITKGGKVFTDSHKLPAGVNQAKMSLPGILAYSSNIGTIKIADRLGAQKLYDYQRKFGLGEATGEGVPGEATGRVLPPDQWSGSAYGSIPIGHSVDATPLQMAAAYATIANGGTWIQPHLVAETIAPDGTRTPAPAPKTRQVISPENAAALREMMEAVVTVPDGTGTKAAIPGYRVAGKTGTGSRVLNGSYAPGEVASFIGMAPADQPRYVVAVFAYTPGGGGGDVSAPVFKKIMNFALTHYRVPQTGTKPPKFVVYPR